MRRNWSPTDIENEFDLIRWLGYPVRADWEGEEHIGTLANITADGIATIEADGFVVALVPHHAIRVIA